MVRVPHEGSPGVGEDRKNGAIEEASRKKRGKE